VWRRALSGGIDAAVLALVGNLLGAIFRNEFIAAGYGGRLVGLLLICAYIGGQNSVLASGRTFGKRLMRLRVVDAAGQPLSLERSLLRAFILALPLLSGGVFVAQRSPVISLLATGLLSVVSAGLAGALLYLYIFNRGTRQSVHDWAAGSFVVDAGETRAPGNRRIWRGHQILLALWLLVPLTVGPVLWWFWSGGFDWQRVFRLQEKVQQSTGDARVEVLHGEFHFLTRSGGTAATRYLQVGVYFPYRVDSFEEAADRVAAVVLKDPAASEADAIRITVSYGFDLLIASRTWSRSFVRTPEDWRQHLQQQTDAPLPTQV